MMCSKDSACADPGDHSAALAQAHDPVAAAEPVVDEHDVQFGPGLRQRQPSVDRRSGARLDTGAGMRQGVGETDAEQRVVVDQGNIHVCSTVANRRDRRPALWCHGRAGTRVPCGLPRRRRGIQRTLTSARSLASRPALRARHERGTNAARARHEREPTVAAVASRRPRRTDHGGRRTSRSSRRSASRLWAPSRPMTRSISDR